MFLFILESIGTSELLLVGIVALMFLGPRKLPGLARQAGKLMSEFRGTASEFKETWQREVNFEEEVKLLNLDSIDDDPVSTAGTTSVTVTTATQAVAPSIKAVDPERLEQLMASKDEPADGDEPEVETDPNEDKKNWL